MCAVARIRKMSGALWGDIDYGEERPKRFEIRAHADVRSRAKRGHGEPAKRASRSLRTSKPRVARPREVGGGPVVGLGGKTDFNPLTSRSSGILSEMCCTADANGCGRRPAAV